MADRIAAPKGTFDVLPADQPLRRWVVARAEAVFERYGYRRIDTPLFEETKLFSRGVGESTDVVRKEMYTFEDLGGRSMTLRPEGTAPVARAFVEHGMRTLPQPVKLYYYSPMFRYESPQSGRYRQHTQLGIEAIGSAAPELDAEVIGVLAAFHDEVGVEGTELHLNSMGCRECRPVYTAVLRSFLASRADALCGECRERAQTNALRVYDCKRDPCRSSLQDAPRLPDHLCPACAQHQRRVQQCLEMQGIAYAPDHTLVRGMDYYTRTTFEFTSSRLGAQSGVGGGGRYDHLVEAIGGPPLAGVGFGTGVERVLLALGQTARQNAVHHHPAAYLVALTPEARDTVFALAHELRAIGVEADLDYAARSGKGQMTQAGRSGARYAFILGEREMSQRAVTVRDMRSGAEQTVPRDEAVALAAQVVSTE